MSARSVVVVGPIAPLRGGIAAHSARLVEALLRSGARAQVLSYSRLYPRLGFPGTSPFHYPSRSQRAHDEPARPDDSLRGGGARHTAVQGAAATRVDAVLDTAAQGAAATRVDALLDTLDPRSWRRAAALLERIDPQLVIAQWWHPVCAPALRRILGARPPATVTIVCHNLLPHEPFPLARTLARATLARAGLVVCHSRVVAGQVCALLPRARVETVALPPLVDLDLPDLPDLLDLPALLDSPAPTVATLASVSRASVTARYGLATDAPVVLMAGHLRSYKGVEVLLEAWQRRARVGPARLLLVGECYLRGQARRRVLAAVDADPSIVFVNRYVDDSELVRLVSICRVLVLPYLGASQSGILPLAAALGVPCVVSDAGGLAEQAPGARVVPRGDVGALGAAIAEVLTERPRSVAAASGVLRPVEPATGAGFCEQWQRVVEVVGGGLRP